MMSNFLIGLREGLEASLVIGILYAYLVRTDRRHLLRPMWAGVAIAVVVSLGFGAVLTFGPKGLSFTAQEAIGGFLSLVAVGFITWMIFWMARTARTLKTDLEGRLSLAAEGGPAAVTIMAMLAVGREGLETALFVWAGVQASGNNTEPLLGALIGIATAIVLGFLITRGAVRINLSKFFTWTAFALIIVAAGILSYGIHDLQEAGILPGLNNLAFDVSDQIPPTSWYGTLLKGTINFSPATTWLEAIAWSVYLVVVIPLFVRTIRQSTGPSQTTRTNPATPTTGSSAPTSPQSFQPEVTT
ncbi:MAG: FTR1 family protein [Microthrixaceae bacterium]|nr:FTR1 family protein [Microthrixaceae bacterium]HPB44540.1 FTR1 family protein [Microthrixaceae bacterium]